MSEFSIKKFIPTVLIWLVILLVGVFVSSVSITSAEKRLDESNNEVAAWQNKISVKQVQSESTKADVEKTATGLDGNRVNNDYNIANAFISKVLTWGTGAEYDAIREEIMTDYRVSEDSAFMTTFLPPNTYTADGSYNLIDLKHTNSKYEDMTQYVSNIDDSMYSYFTFVTWSTSDVNGYEAKSTCVFTYTIDSYGNMTNISGNVISQ